MPYLACCYDSSFCFSSHLYFSQTVTWNISFCSSLCLLLRLFLSGASTVASACTCARGRVRAGWSCRADSAIHHDHHGSRTGPSGLGPVGSSGCRTASQLPSVQPETRPRHSAAACRTQLKLNSLRFAPLTPICWSKDQHLHCLPRLIARFRLESFFSSSYLVLNPRLVLQLGIKSRILHIINHTDVALDATSVCEGPT